MWAASSGETPGPWSRTSSTANGPSDPTANSTGVPAGVCVRAFSVRFERICRTFSSSAKAITRGARVVVVSTASGLKFADFKIGYHEATLAAAPSPRWRNQPIAVAARYDDVRVALDRGLDAAR